MPCNIDNSGATLFPILPRQLTGLARMASEAEHADDGHLVEFRTLKVRSVLNRTVSKRLAWLAYSINPYRGCEFGCRYCYARYTHEFLAPNASAIHLKDAVDFLDPAAFERVIFLKQNAAWLLEQDLKHVDPRREIALGTATDPYQPIERRVGITRSLLEVFARKEGYRLGIVTKSTLIERDIDLLTEISRKNKLVVHITITTADAELARKARASSATTRPTLRYSQKAGRGWARRRSFVLPSAAGDHRFRGSYRRNGTQSIGRRRNLFRGESTLPEVLLATNLRALFGGAFPRAGRRLRNPVWSD